MAFYKEADGFKYAMEQRWQRRLKNQFPSNKKDIIKKFNAIEDFLNKDHHPYVNLGAANNGDGVLTDHGTEHIQMVMNKAFKIVGDRVAQINGYEIFLLLIAIHFHDLGNIYGREEHEKKISKVIEAMGDTLPLDTVEKMCVTQIAMAHGGYNDDEKTDRDTIRHLASKQPCNEIEIRPSLLATILRLADELSDDFSRAIDMPIHPDNEIYHAYSKSLEPIYFEGETISFHYLIPYELTQKQIKKGNKSIYLYDEIRNRLTKCMQELEYCRKYAGGFIGITTLNVTIDMMSKDKPLSVAEKDSFRLRLLGYPNKDQFQLENYIEQPSSCGVKIKTPKYSSGTDLKRAMVRSK